MRLAQLVEMAKGMGLSVAPTSKRNELITLIKDARNHPPQEDEEGTDDDAAPSASRLSFNAELEKRKKKPLDAPSAFNNELNRRLGKVVGKSSLAEELKVRKNKFRR